MFHYVLRSLLGRAARAAFLAFAVLAVSVSYPFVLAASERVQVTADQSLDQYWRTTYDILVRPNGSRTSIEERHGLVEANHLSNIWGGITLAQYRAIKSIPAIEVAAPVTILGYLAVPIVTPVDLPQEPDTTVLLKQILAVDNGLRSIVFEGQSARITLTRGQSMAFPNPRTGTWSEYFPVDQADGYPLRFTAFVPLAAVDPEEEARLIGLDRCVIEGRYLFTSDETFEVLDRRGVKTRRPAERRGASAPTISSPSELPQSFEEMRYLEIPILLNIHNYMDVSGEVEVYGLHAAGEKEYLYSRPIHFYRQMLDVLLSGRVRGRTFYPIFPLPRGVEYRQAAPPFKSQDALVLEAIPTEKLGISFRTSTGETPEVKPLDIVAKEALYNPGSGEAAFRSLRSRRENKEFSDLPVTFDLKGTFDIDELQHLIGDPNSVPFETYFPPRAVLRYDEEGNSTAPLTLKPTLSPYGYLLSPPIALTNLNAAYILAGDAPISAIRVRVRGIEALDEAAQKKIEAVVGEIYRRTGLDVDIMVGSSPQHVLVHIPGEEQAPPVGYVEEYWIKKNVNTLISQSINKVSLIFFSMMLVVCLLFILSTSILSTLGRTQEAGLLKAIGWYTRTLFAATLVQTILISLITALFGLAVALGLVRFFAFSVSVRQVLFVAPLSFALVLTGSLYPAWRASRIPPAVALRKGETRSKPIPWSDLSLLSYAGRSLLRRPSRSTIALGTLSVSAAFLVLVLLAVQASQGYLVGTLLGEYILERVKGYHYLLIAFCLLFSALAVGDMVWMGIIERRGEIGVLKVVGWGHWQVAGLFVREGLLLGLVGGVLGLVIGLAIYGLLYGGLPARAWWVVLPALGVPVVVGALAAWYPARRAARIPPAEAVRYE